MCQAGVLRQPSCSLQPSLTQGKRDLCLGPASAPCLKKVSGTVPLCSPLLPTLPAGCCLGGGKVVGPAGLQEGREAAGAAGTPQQSLAVGLWSHPLTQSADPAPGNAWSILWDQHCTQPWACLCHGHAGQGNPPWHREPRALLCPSASLAPRGEVSLPSLVLLLQHSTRAQLAQEPWQAGTAQAMCPPPGGAQCPVGSGAGQPPSPPCRARV